MYVYNIYMYLYICIYIYVYICIYIYTSTYILPHHELCELSLTEVKSRLERRERGENAHLESKAEHRRAAHDHLGGGGG